MRPILSFALCVLVALAARAADEPKKDELKGDAAKVQGKWKAIELKAGGSAVAADVVAAIKLEFAGDVLKVSGAGDAGDMSLSMKLDEKSTPKQIDLTHNGGEKKGTTILGVYQLDGDALQMTFPIPDTDPRPKAVRPDDESKAIILTLQRDK